MIAIKNMEMPTDCKKCSLMGTDGNPKELLSPMMCIAIWATTHEIRHCIGGKIRDDCPLVEIEERKVEKLEKIKQIMNATEYIENDITYSYCYNQERKVKEIKEVLESEG